MDTVSLKQLAQQSISCSFGVFDSPSIDTVKEKTISSYLVEQGKYVFVVVNEY